MEMRGGIRTLNVFFAAIRASPAINNHRQIRKKRLSHATKEEAIFCDSNIFS